MSAKYRAPGTNVEVLDNPRIINLGESARITAIVGMGPSKRYVYSEAIQRSTGTVDYLSCSTQVAISATRASIVPTTSLPSSYSVLRSNNGSMYQLSSATISPTAGTIVWPQVTNPDVPATGSVYYVDYSFDVPSTQYDPAIMSDKEYIVQKYGAESESAGILTTAALINLENGAPGVMLVQASGSTYSEAAYKSAIDKLQKKTNIEDLVVVFPKNTTKANQETLLSYAYSHMLNMNGSYKERGLITGSPTSDFSSDGFDTIGDPSIPASYVGRAAALKNKNHVYVACGTVKRKDAQGNYMTLDANFAAAGLAGLRASRAKRSEPVHGKTLAGFELTEEKWNDFEMDQLGAGNCTVLSSVAGVVIIRDNITTDPTSADTQEPSVVDQERLVKRSLRTGLNNTYANRGLTITPNTPDSVNSTAAAILGTLVNEGEIYEYGQSDNPLTGEKAIKSKQNPLEPRKIDVVCSVKYLYPLKWMDVSVSVYV